MSDGLSPNIWDDREYYTIPQVETKLIWLYLCQGREAREARVRGLLTLTTGSLADGVRLGYQDCENALRFLEEERGWIEVDKEHRLIRVKNAPLHGYLNPNVLQGWARKWRELPRCATKFRHLESIRRAVEAGSVKLQEAWAKYWTDLATEGEQFLNASPNRMVNSSRTAQVSLLEPLPKPLPSSLNADADLGVTLTVPEPLGEHPKTATVVGSGSGSETGSGSEAVPEAVPDTAAALRLWGLEQELRAAVRGAPPARKDPTPGELNPIQLALESYDYETLEHVLRVDAAAASSPDAKPRDLQFFNGVSNWAPKHIEFAKNQCVRATAGYVPVNGRKKFSGKAAV